MTAARFAAAAAIAVALVVLALHALEPALAPSWRFVSEYANGRHGWLMQCAFGIWAAGCAALAFALRREARGGLGRSGIAVLALVAAALVVAGVFPQDPVTATPDQATRSGRLHALASMVGIPGIPIAALLLAPGLRRAFAARGASAVRWTTHATWISLAAMAAYLAWAVPRAGGFGPGVWAGWMNRVVIASYLAWQLAVASRLAARDAA
ncbi:MAG: hypothetical protein DCC71_00405 [Proteobacteria bacterium]|nr:MAG: hypothetical protein DCC71_00405 [Pseudomonadota bacterium]